MHIDDIGFGYDAGYRHGPLWRRIPAQYVIKSCEKLSARPALCLDIGCGEGKNAAYIAATGIRVVAVDGSVYALENATSACRELSNIEWHNCEAIDFLKKEIRLYDLIVCTGLAHCLSNEAQLVDLLNLSSNLMNPSGLFVFSSFNNRRQDLSGHEESFSPLLLSHERLIAAIEQTGLRLLESRDDDIEDLHPHIGIRHYHSITRALCSK